MSSGLRPMVDPVHLRLKSESKVPLLDRADADPTLALTAIHQELYSLYQRRVNEVAGSSEANMKRFPHIRVSLAIRHR